MPTKTYNALTEQQRREVAMYGCTEQQMAEAVEQRMQFITHGDYIDPSGRSSRRDMIVASLLSDVQEMIDPDYGPVDWSRAEDARQALNRAKWILFNK